MNNMEYKPKYPVQTLEKALEIIKYFKNHSSGDGVSISELSEQLNMGKSSVHRILDTLYAYNFVEKTVNGSAYKLGWELFDIGNIVPLQHSLGRSDYVSLLEHLCTKCSETVNLGIINNDSVIIIYKIEPNIRLRSNVQIGSQEPLYCTSLGKVFLSEMRDSEIQEFYNTHKIERFTEKTIVSPKKMIAEVQKIREQGYSIDDEEYYIGHTCIGMPVRNYANKIIGAISVSGPTQRIKGPKLAEILEELKLVSERLSIHMGYKLFHDDE